MAIVTQSKICSENIGRTMQLTISQSKISLSPSPLSVCSFSHSPSLWCPTLACTSRSNKLKHCKLESRSTTIVAPIPRIQVKGQSQDEFKPIADAHLPKHQIDPKQKPGGQTRGQLSHPTRKDGVIVATGDLSVNVSLETKGDGKYLLKMERIIQSSTHDGSEEAEVERAKKMAQNAGLLLLHAEMLQEMGQKLLDQSRASLRSMFKKSDS